MKESYHLPEVEDCKLYYEAPVSRDCHKINSLQAARHLSTPNIILHTVFNTNNCVPLLDHFTTSCPTHQKSTSKLPLGVLPLNSLEGTACHIYNASCWAGYHSNKPLSNSFQESSCTFSFSPFKRKRNCFNDLLADINNRIKPLLLQAALELVCIGKSPQSLITYNPLTKKLSYGKSHIAPLPVQMYCCSLNTSPASKASI